VTSKVRLTQKKEIAPRSIHGNAIYSDQTISGYIGAIILVDYDIKRIDQGTPANIKVIAPDGQEVATDFDLGPLR
jgi:hypothetical protein